MLDQDEHSAETRQRRWVVKGRTLLESKIGKSTELEEKENPANRKDQPNQTVTTVKNNQSI